MKNKEKYDLRYITYQFSSPTTVEILYKAKLTDEVSIKVGESITTTVLKWLEKDLQMNQNENVVHPSHYNKGIEAIKYIESWDMNFNIGNVVKYVSRAKYKGNELEDLEKAMFYLNEEIELLKSKKDK